MALITPDAAAPNKLEALKVIIRDLLRTVREKFGVVAIEPQLTKDHFDDTIGKLPELCPSHNLQGLLECATKEILYDIAVCISVLCSAASPHGSSRLTEIVD